MNTLRYVFCICLLISLTSKGYSQTTAMDFNRKDCMGNSHHLFGDLDSGKVVILEFFMQSCSPCIAAGKKLEDMKSKLLAQYPGRIKAYAIGYSNTYSCASNAIWVSSNGLTSIPMDSGAAQVAYYGGMGMPTIVILGGGKEHRVLGSPYVGFSTSDTTQMLADIRQSFKTLSVEPVKADITSIRVYPNPVSSELTLDINLKEDGVLTIEILDVTGKIINTVCNIDATSGESSYTFNTSELAPGLYYIQISANGSIQQVKFNVLH